MTETTYRNVLDVVREITGDAELVGVVSESLDRQSILRQIMARRAFLGMSQTDVGKIMACSQGRISKLECAADDDLKYGDLRQYAPAVGCDLRSGLRPNEMTPAEEVKCLALAVNDRLSRMAELANQDGEIAEGVAKFFVEALLNFSLIVGRASALLPKGSDGVPRFEVRFEVKKECDDPDPDSEDCCQESLQRGVVVS